MTLMPKESAKMIDFCSKNVSVEEEGIKNLAYMVNNFLHGVVQIF